MNVTRIVLGALILLGALAWLLSFFVRDFGWWAAVEALAFTLTFTAVVVLGAWLVSPVLR